MQALNQMTASLQEQISYLESSGQFGGKRLAIAIVQAIEIIQATKTMARGMPNHALLEFLNANAMILQQLLQIANNPGVENQLITQSTVVMQQLSMMYQDAIVPMLTRLHNLCTESVHAPRITAITSLGNEIITYSAQMNQFSEKFILSEKILAMFGIILMLTSISMMVTILSKNSLEISLLTALVLMASGCSVCKKIMQAHLHDPGTDLIVTSVKKMEPLIYDVAKAVPEDQAQLRMILTGSSAAPPAPPARVKTTPTTKATPAPTPAPPTTAAPPETPTEPAANEENSATFMNKLKGMLDLFNTKK